MNLILDSNVIVSAFSSRGLCSSIFELCLDRYTIIISKFILSEVYKTLYNKYKMPQNNVDMIVEYLTEFCMVKDYEKFGKRVCRDKDDDEILALGESSKAKYIITGDKDLLILKKFHSIKILTPREFWEVVRKVEK